MGLPDGVRTAVERRLPDLGLGRRLTRSDEVGGGCINNGARVETDSGEMLFLKWNPTAPAGMFAAEADGLTAVAGACPLRVPTPLAWSEPGRRPSWLLMEYVQPGRALADTERRLGRGLAAMHTTILHGGFGWERDNWLGSLDQVNAPAGNWVDFWRDRRLAPQLTLARARGLARDGSFDRLLDVLPQALADVDLPVLVHGDLWGGNWFTSATGEPVLIDPAVYRGHAEVDLAMTELFGGFGPSFYEAYGETCRLPRAYAAYRKDLYQLYYLLAHVNLFGGTYEAGSLRAARRVLAALGA